jgi:GH15 family glucan-1,4-alpha-glucosidase
VPLSVRYVPGTMILETTWMTPSGWIVVHDGLTIGPWHDDHADETSHTRPPTDYDADHMLVRHLECIQGTVQVEAVCEPMFDYGRTPARWEMVEEDWSAAEASDGETILRLITDLRIGIEGNRARARHTLTEGEERFVALGWRHGLNGPDWEADDFMQFVADLGRDGDGALQIMYGLGGERDLHEQELRHSVYLHTRAGGHIPQRLWPILQDQVRCALDVWQKPDQGIWEARGEPKQYVSSKLMCWVAADRGSRLAALEGELELAAEWRSAAEEIRKDILAHGVSDRGVFRQHYETDALDASTLLLPLVRFLPADDERVKATVLAIESELQESGFVLRYRVAETDDGLTGEEGTFLICSFWLVSALSEIGEPDRARELCERLLAHASALGLYAEELEARTGRHLGNYPQAFTHLALINAVMHVISHEEA